MRVCSAIRMVHSLNFNESCLLSKMYLKNERYTVAIMLLLYHDYFNAELDIDGCVLWHVHLMLCILYQ